MAQITAMPRRNNSSLPYGMVQIHSYAEIVCERKIVKTRAFCQGEGHRRKGRFCYRVRGLAGRAFAIEPASQSQVMCSCGLALFWSSEYQELGVYDPAASAARRAVSAV